MHLIILDKFAKKFKFLFHVSAVNISKILCFRYLHIYKHRLKMIINFSVKVINLVSAMIFKKDQMKSVVLNIIFKELSVCSKQNLVKVISLYYNLIKYQI